MTNKDNSLNWFEIPASDIKRATKFYETIFSVEMPQMEMGGSMAFFPADMQNGRVGGAVVQSDMHKPSVDGAVIYLNANPDLDIALSKVEKAGGKVVMPKTKITDEIGFMAFFIDTEGNKVGMHSNK